MIYIMLPTTLCFFSHNSVEREQVYMKFSAALAERITIQNIEKIWLLVKYCLLVVT